ncbi:MAG: xanthine dehydrogenase family protein subunit M [Chloroflexota bacterium]|nr:xanthine dehydrogenase family protein subunit M [Chloroflexota bacterium]
MRPFEYSSAPSIDAALEILGQTNNGAIRPLAGGTDLLTLMKADIVTPDHLVDIKRATDLTDGVEETGDGLRIGALTSLTELETNPLVRERYPALAEAAAIAATPQLRNMATIGGNLLQRPRCWYYRNPLFHCWLKGGDTCHARDGQNRLHALFGDSPCVATHPSDPATALLALDASVTVRGASGERHVPLSDFFALPSADRRTETTLQPGELVVDIRLPASGMQSTYLKAMDRKVWAFALVSVAAAIQVEDGKISAARLVLGGVAPMPWRVPAVEQALIGSAPDAATFDRAAEAALTGAQPLEHNGYKVPLAQSLVRQALGSLVGGADG